MGLVDMFKELAENNRESNFVKYTDVTWMLVDVSPTYLLTHLSLVGC